MSSFNLSLASRIKGVRLQDPGSLWDRFDQPESAGSKAEPIAAADAQEQGSVGLSDIEIAEIRTQAYEQGFAEGESSGRSQGTEAGKQSLAPRVTLLENIIQTMQDERETFYRENELTIVKLAIEISRKIIHRELNQNPEILVYVVREALRRVTDKQQITLRVNPGDLKLLEHPDAALSAVIKGFKKVEFVAAEEIEPGGCVIESEAGIVDATIQAQLERIEQSLVEGSHA